MDQTSKPRVIRAETVMNCFAAAIVGGCALWLPPVIPIAFGMMLVPSLLTARMANDQLPHFAMPMNAVIALGLFVKDQQLAGLQSMNGILRLQELSSHLEVGLFGLLTVYAMKSARDGQSHWLWGSLFAGVELALIQLFVRYALF